jgi:FkbH-like protein
LTTDDNIRIALLSNVNMNLLARYLSVCLSDTGSSAEIYQPAGYGQVASEMLDAQSSLYAYKPNLVVLFLDPRELFPALFTSPLSLSSDDRMALADLAVAEVISSVEAYLARAPGIVLVNTIVNPPRDVETGLEAGGERNLLRGMERRFNEELVARFADNGRVFVFDFFSLVLEHGYTALFDDKWWYMGRMPLGDRGLSLLADEIAARVRSLRKPSMKCIITDLDGTLWGGILGEDGLDGIRIGEEAEGRPYLDIQRKLRRLKETGILIAIASKNDEAAALAALRDHPEMTLRPEDFAAWRINWGDKAENVRAIIEELNIGADSILFLDDSAFERERVRDGVPGVLVPDLPEDPVEIPAFVARLAWDTMFKSRITAEDKARTAMVREEGERRQLRTSSGTLEDFYRSLEMTLTFMESPTKHAKRLSQLTLKTNQFNLTTRRYTDEDMARMLEGPAFVVFAASLRDRFGDSGIVSLLIAEETKKGTALIDTFLMSCRVVGRTVEKAFLALVARHLRERGITKLVGEYLPTAKNGLVRDLYPSLGFSRVSEGSYELDLGKTEIPLPDWFKVEKP